MFLTGIILQMLIYIYFMNGKFCRLKQGEKLTETVFVYIAQHPCFDSVTSLIMLVLWRILT